MRNKRKWLIGSIVIGLLAYTIAALILSRIEQKRENEFTSKYIKRNEKYINGLLQPLTQSEISDAHIQYHLLKFCEYVLKDKKSKALAHMEWVLVWCDQDSTRNASFKANCLRSKSKLEAGDVIPVKKLSKEYVDRWEKYEAQIAAIEKIQNTREWQLANEMVSQYEIAERHGDKMQMYVQAGLCAAGFLQAQDEDSYKKWKDLERKIGSQIGIPQY